MSGPPADWLMDEVERLRRIIRVAAEVAAEESA